MTKKMSTLPSAAALVLASLLAGACGQSPASEDGSAARPRVPIAAAAAAAAPTPQAATVAAVRPREVSAVTPAGGPAPDEGGEIVFTGKRDETEQFIRHYQTIALTPEQERIKVEALSTIPAPCCADNPLATCCCPCNLAKASWGMAAWRRSTGSRRPTRTALPAMPVTPAAAGGRSTGTAVEGWTRVASSSPKFPRGSSITLLFSTVRKFCVFASGYYTRLGST